MKLCFSQFCAHNPSSINLCWELACLRLMLYISYVLHVAVILKKPLQPLQQISSMDYITSKMILALLASSLCFHPLKWLTCGREHSERGKGGSGGCQAAAVGQWRVAPGELAPVKALSFFPFSTALSDPATVAIDSSCCRHLCLSSFIRRAKVFQTALKNSDFI